jgi:6-phosphogluconolactonase
VWASSGGRTPRFIVPTPAGHALVVANEDSDRIAALEIDRMTGELTSAGEVARTGSPVCIVFDEAR